MSERSRDSDSLAGLRSAALVVLAIGAAGTMALMLRAGGRNRPIILVPMFALWDISPFVLLWLADRLGTRWALTTRRALYYVMIMVTVGSVAAYIADLIWPRTAQAAFMYVIVPPVSWMFIAVALSIAALFSRRTLMPRQGAS